ncbi:hypothetical protein M9458_010742, partial [Cirrhinus mrigala]
KHLEPVETIHQAPTRCQKARRKPSRLDEKVKGNDSDECSDEIKARKGDHQEEGENEGDEDEMV